jgi:hypothetical protein
LVADLVGEESLLRDRITMQWPTRGHIRRPSTAVVPANLDAYRAFEEEMHGSGSASYTIFDSETVADTQCDQAQTQGIVEIELGTLVRVT